MRCGQTAFAKTAFAKTAFDLGGPEGAEAVVLIHGLGLSRDLWRPFAEHLRRQYRVLTYDLYGHGESRPAPQSGAEPLSLGVFAQQLDDLMAYTGVASAHMIGFSIGGMINRRLAMDFPERCRSLIIINAPHDRGEEAQEAVESRARKVQEDGKMATLPAALERWLTPSFREAHPHILAEITRWRQSADDANYAEAAWVLAHGVRELIGPTPPLDLPACVITTANDTGSTPLMAEKIAQEIKGSRLIIVPGLQHLGLMERPQDFITVIDDFLASVKFMGNLGSSSTQKQGATDDASTYPQIQHQKNLPGTEP